MTDIRVDLTVNGIRHEQTIPARRSLADFVRDDLGHTGTHLGCEHGVCGSCTILRDGRTIRSCLTLAAQVEGSEIETIEGVTGEGSLGRAIADAFKREGGLQCGFCTPGFIISAIELLNTGDPLDDEAVREALSGNTCRCTGYAGIVRAILSVYADRLRASEGD